MHVLLTDFVFLVCPITGAPEAVGQLPGGEEDGDQVPGGAAGGRGVRRERVRIHDMYFNIFITPVNRLSESRAIGCVNPAYDVQDLKCNPVTGTTPKPPRGRRG